MLSMLRLCAIILLTYELMTILEKVIGLAPYLGTFVLPSTLIHPFSPLVEQLSFCLNI